MSSTRSSAARWAATFVASITGTLYLVVGTVVMGLLTIVGSWVMRRSWFHWTARVWARGWLLASGCRLRTVGADSLEPASYVFMANHSSYYDVAALLTTLPTPTRFLAKHTLFRIPILGWAMRSGGFVDIDREDLSRSRKSFAKSVRGMAGGFSLLVFPEGTRSTGGKLLPFKRGGFLLALKTGRPIVPVGIRGARQVQPKGKHSIRPGRIEVHYGEPIEVEEYGVRGRAELMEKVRGRISELSGFAAEAEV